MVEPDQGVVVESDHPIPRRDQGLSDEGWRMASYHEKPGWHPNKKRTDPIGICPLALYSLENAIACADGFIFGKTSSSKSRSTPES